MYNPSLRSLHSLIILSVVSIALFYFAQTSYKDVKAKHYDQKIKASKIMGDYLQTLKQETQNRDYSVDLTNDPNDTGLIGVSISRITTSSGALSERLTSLNPNMAAVCVDLLKSVRLKKGDHVAVGLTGANPGANLALYAALEALELKPVIITAVGSAQFGANREDFTWLDMEKVLYDAKMISFKSNFASYGGGKDMGRGLSKEGRDLIGDAIERNSVTLIKEASLEENIEKRMELYDFQLPKGKKFKLFVNLGGGLANIGNAVNAKLIKNGLNRSLPEKNFATPGAMMLFAKRNIPVVHIFKIVNLAQKYGLPINPEPLPEIGTGKVFVSKINNVTIASICLAVLLIAIFIVIFFDRKDRHFTSNILPKESDL